MTVLALGLSGCAKPEQKPSPGPLPATSVFSPEAAPRADAGEPGDAGLEVASAPEPGALDEILGKAPKTRPSTTGPDGGTLVGVPTGSDAKDAGAGDAGPAEAPRAAEVMVGQPEVQPGLPAPAVERALRAQVYWPLVQKCRDKEGKILPPDAVTLQFKIDPEGFIVSSSVSATAANPEHEAAAVCMRRMLGAATFRAPPAGRGTHTIVDATVPSVD